ncbi:MAG: hypothetical protein WC632_07070 [Candidatus Margulisiibacteriota bacterium]
MNADKIRKLRTVINECLRVQQNSDHQIPYIDSGNTLDDVMARQNHVIFGRRGCGKTLLLNESAKRLLKIPSIKTIYLNCEDFKKHSFPNVLIEILDSLFGTLEQNLSGWFGRKKRSRELITGIRKQLYELKRKQDERESDVREKEATKTQVNQKIQAGIGAQVGMSKLGFEALDDSLSDTTQEKELHYKINENKMHELNNWLPELKRQIKEFFKLSKSVDAIFLQIDDFYHLRRVDQPLVIDFIHRLCKDLPLFFKLATLRHGSTLYIDSNGQPVGAQERHDYQPIDIDFTFTNFSRTVEQNRRILQQFGSLAGFTPQDINNLFKGNGFERLVLAGGGVPRDCLSLFLEVLEKVKSENEDGQIGKDDVRILSRSNFERRIEELKQDSEGDEQKALISGIYALRQFCIAKKTNIIIVSEATLQKEDKIRNLLYRLLDYRIIHIAGTALTHKSQPGTYHAFVIDIGCYAFMRVLEGRFNEIDLGDTEAKEKMRSAPILDKELNAIWQTIPVDAEAALKTQENN